MSAVPVASYLTEFGACDDVAPPPAAPERDAEATDDMAARLEAAHAKGLESGEAAAMALLEAKLQEQQAAFAHQLAGEREAWVAREAEALAARLDAGLRELEARIADCAARVLAPILTAELRRQAIVGLRAELDTLLEREPGLGIAISGPEDLMHALRDHLAGKSCAVTCTPWAEPDVRVTAGATVLETRLGAWAAQLEEALR
jgi:hypothetical protein